MAVVWTQETGVADLPWTTLTIWTPAHAALSRAASAPTGDVALYDVAACVAEAPMACVSMGAGEVLENYAIIRRRFGGL